LRIRSDVSTAFWHRKKHTVSLPYINICIYVYIKRLKVSNYRYSNGQWWSKTDKDPKDLIDHNQFSGSDGTWHLDYCTTCEEWGHNDCDFVEDDDWGSPTHYDPYDDEYANDD
jgi:hypothetical protein